MERRQLLVVTGKGGVGKSALTASLGRILARAGRRVLLLEIDPRESLYAMLGIPPSGGSIVPAGPGLYVQNLRPREVIDRIVRERVRIDLLSSRVLASPIYHQFAEGAPGLKEMAVVAHAKRLVDGDAGADAPPVDMVLLDAPATGHGISLLAAPGLVAETIQDGPVGRMGRQLASFVADPERCGVVLATQAEEMPVQEALELLRELESRLSRRPDLLIVNGLYPSASEPDRESAARRDPAVSLWLDRRRIHDRELRRLDEAWNGPRADLPLVPSDRGPELISALEVALEQAMSRSA